MTETGDCVARSGTGELIGSDEVEGDKNVVGNDVEAGEGGGTPPSD